VHPLLNHGALRDLNLESSGFESRIFPRRAIEIEDEADLIRCGLLSPGGDHSGSAPYRFGGALGSWIRQRYAIAKDSLLGIGRTGMNRIMVVDDAPYLREVMREIIEPEGYEVVRGGGNGLEALERFADYQPDLVLMDLVMPRFSGIEGTKMILNRFPSANIVVSATLGQESMIVEAFQAGARGYVMKPFRPDEVLFVLSRILEKRLE